jgi:hypothetical protein
MQVEIKNNSKAAQGVMTINGRVWIGAGKSREVEVGSLSRIEALPYLEVLGETEEDAPELSKMSVTALKAFAEANSIDLGDATKKADIISAIELALEAE